MDWTVLGQQVWYGLVTGAGYVLFATGITIIIAVIGILNMAHGELSMLAAILAYSLTAAIGLNYFLAVPIVVVITTAIGFVISRISVRPLLNVSPLSVLLSTIALSYIMLNATMGTWGTQAKTVVTPLKQVYSLGGIAISEQSIFLFVVGMVLIGILHYWLSKAKLGKRMRATAQSELGASLTGVNVKGIYDYTVMISAGLAGLAGALLAPILTASPTLGQPILIKGFAIMVIAGLGNVAGVFTVGLGVAIIEALFGQYVSNYFREIFIYGLMIVVLLIKPEGLFFKR